MVVSAPEGCVHIWNIAPANGHTSPGVCRKCGEVRDFLNSCDEVLEQAAFGRPLDFRAPRKKEEETMSKLSGIKGHREIEKRWPEIKRTIEELGSLNKAALKLGFSYDGVNRACGRHGFDSAPYKSGSGRKAAPVRETDGQAFKEKLPANGHDNIGELLMGAGLVMIGGWLKQREEGR